MLPCFKNLQLRISFIEPQRLVDCFGINERVSSTSTSTTTTGRRDFTDRVWARDQTCVITGAPQLICQAAHLIPRSKGDNVRVTFSFRYEFLMLQTSICLMSLAFGRESDNNLHLGSINDTRNGHLIQAGLHHLLDLGAVAFLQASSTIRYHCPPQ